MPIRKSIQDEIGRLVAKDKKKEGEEIHGTRPVTIGRCHGEAVSSLWLRLTRGEAVGGGIPHR